MTKRESKQRNSVKPPGRGDAPASAQAAGDGGPSEVTGRAQAGDAQASDPEPRQIGVVTPERSTQSDPAGDTADQRGIEIDHKAERPQWSETPSPRGDG